MADHWRSIGKKVAPRDRYIYFPILPVRLNFVAPVVRYEAVICVLIQGIETLRNLLKQRLDPFAGHKADSLSVLSKRNPVLR